MNRRSLLAMVLLIAAFPFQAGAANQTSSDGSVSPAGSSLAAGAFTIELGAPDDPAHPVNWLGPMIVTAPGGKHCSVSEDVAILTRPFFLVHGDILYVNTSSGSESTVYAINLKTCAVAWTSPNFVGLPTLSGTRISLPGTGNFVIGKQGLPKPASSTTP
jgi:hypothetical protein